MNEQRKQQQTLTCGLLMPNPLFLLHHADRGLGVSRVAFSVQKLCAGLTQNGHIGMSIGHMLGVNLKDGYNGDLTSKEAGSIGGEMVRRMIRKQEEQMK